LGSVMTVVLLVAIGLTADGLAARDNALIPLIWLRTLLPGIICAVILFVPIQWQRRGSAASEPPPETPMGAASA
jgi:lipopolysaccharide export system permease protein